MTNIAIESLQLTKRYRGQSRKSRPALDAVNLHIEAGQLYGLIGPDGAGKTTLIRILATVIKSTAGSAHVSSSDVVGQAEQVRARLGYMPQAFSLYPDLSVMENLLFFADMNGVPRGKQNSRIEELLEFAGLTSFTTRHGRNLSGGMQKKIGFGLRTGA